MPSAISKLSRCLLLPLFLLLFTVVFTVIITSTIVSYPYPCILFSTSHAQSRLPYPLRSQISNLQSQVGTLLKDLHSEETSNPKITSKYADQLLRVAVSLDKFATYLSQFRGEEPDNPCGEAQAEDNAKDGEDGESDRTRSFSSNEAESYISSMANRNGRNFLGVEAIQPSVGLACASMPTSFDNYMSYKVHGACPDDWPVAQKLMLAGCDPLPRRRCFSRSPPHYSRPLPSNSSVWNLPSDGNILWTHYKCKGFSCLASNSTKTNKGFFKCSGCFDLSKRGWLTSTNANISAEFGIDEVLRLKPGEIRIGLDFSPSTGTFAAVLRERNVTVVSATLNLGAPFNEMIALRGLIPLYISVGSRLPFFDNTLDLVHSTVFLDGWIHPELLEYVLFDWDRVLRPGGLLWVDRFFCTKDNMDLYLEEFGRLGYKQLLWRVVPKTDRNGDELFLSAVLEKPLRNS